jgi:nicotinate phosphoribosyltransferase
MTAPSALFADLYSLTMMRAYREAGMGEEGMGEEAVFSLYVRKLPPERNFFLACGVEDVLDAVENLRFAGDDIAYLRSLGRFPEPFLDYLRRFSFTGRIRGIPEGTPVFADEPLLEVTAPIDQAQLLEAMVINLVQSQTLFASKAARIVLAAQGRTVADFGSRRAHGFDAALNGARAFHVAGVGATSNLLAGRRYGIPVIGTMAHSFVEAFATEADAFDAMEASFPETVLLVDTYDTLAAVRDLIARAKARGPAFRVRGIRLDSGDLATLARDARAMLDEAGLTDVSIFASGGLDEHEIARLVAESPAIDAFGVGTAMSVSDDVPALDIVYKLVSIGGRGVMKLSSRKKTLPGAKQVFRRYEDDGTIDDTLCLADEHHPGEPLLVEMMRDGRRLGPRPALSDIRDRAAAALARLPEGMRGLGRAHHGVRVTSSPKLEALTRSVEDHVARMKKPGA